MSGKLRVTEIFDSIEGEGKRAGKLATFVRLTGCNLRCSYCDTAYAFDGGEEMRLDDIVHRIHYHNVTLTGGEPLAQDVRDLLDALRGHDVNIETNGSINIQPFFRDYPDAFFTIDYKCGGSGMTKAMCLSNFSNMRKKDVLKFVVGSREDLEQAFDVFRQFYGNLRNRQIFVSPVFGQIDPQDIVAFMKENNLWSWRVQLQLHKFIWNPQERGV